MATDNEAFVKSIHPAAFVITFGGKGHHKCVCYSAGGGMFLGRGHTSDRAWATAANLVRKDQKKQAGRAARR